VATSLDPNNHSPIIVEGCIDASQGRPLVFFFDWDLSKLSYRFFSFTADVVYESS
jgi:hypothetical protein